eukprot:scaffold266_cov391-Prasinococcus_capsulatus_cf.AAC.21
MGSPRSALVTVGPASGMRWTPAASVRGGSWAWPRAPPALCGSIAPRPPRRSPPCCLPLSASATSL